MRRFLYTIVILILVVAVTLFVLRIYSKELTQLTLVPRTEFVPQDALADNAYTNPDMWFSRPGMGAPNDPARWQPQEAEGSVPPPAVNDTPLPRFAVFFVHPTSFTDNRVWNAPLDDEPSQDLARLLVRGLGSAFNQASEIWAPRYRQATFGAFLSDSDEAKQAVDAAYRDVDLAFTYFLSSIDADMPIVLAGHSQGSQHILRLLRERIAGTPLQQRIAMAYPIGWPISVEHDLPALPLPACATAQQAGCIVSWASFAEPADPGIMFSQYAGSTGFDGELRGDSPILCTNPLSGAPGGSEPAGANLGTLVPSDDLGSGELVTGAVPARCDDAGFLLIGDPPEMGTYVLPFNNYHVYDIPLFWRSLQQDVVRRVAAWEQGS
ncbi:hypothetical protein GCM10009127_14620 [Alteraurantiacibacter aestuarii]|uniref:DUF3089 domain-containing protein n=1 Tax=Alteraurantiacibacter aestuarii TaxID=650004 RepID=A0A844ZLN5_9SPHN|nr:DUF3089 domain-containing protein [Alteraurantiacibacter aestuarii]MXO87950.1 DUF3089 domain-containing protein [Alteraurantiacibacter aestuarii]